MTPGCDSSFIESLGAEEDGGHYISSRGWAEISLLNKAQVIRLT